MRRPTEVALDWPFLGNEGLACGVLNRYQLCTGYDAVFRNVYVPRFLCANPRSLKRTRESFLHVNQ